MIASKHNPVAVGTQNVTARRDHGFELEGKRVDINVVLCSRDEALGQLCREILGTRYGTEWQLTIGNPLEAPSAYDFCIWDFVPGETQVPGKLPPDTLRSHLFLLHRKDLHALSDLVGTSDLQILLKPVTRFMLQAFLEGTCRKQNADPAVRIGALRAERDEMLQCLMRAYLKLQEYDQERTNFLARSLHDFRAPLTAVSGYCALLLDRQLGDLTTEQRDVLERMQRSAKRLSHMAKAMFQLSIAPNVEQQLNLQETDIRECIGQAVHEITPVVDDKRLVLTVDIEPPPNLLVCEESRVEEVLVNLLDNAGKFTPSGGTIKVQGYPYFWERRNGHTMCGNLSADRRIERLTTPNSYRIDIRDSGPGIPPLYVDKIFEEYTSYSGGQDRSGGGLGLAICRLIVRLHGGKIWAETNPSGAVLSFVLPYRSPEKAHSSAGSNAFTTAM